MKFYTACAIKGNKILVRGYKDGVRFTDSVSFKPSLFIKSDKETKYKTLTGIGVKRMIFDTLYDCREFLKQYEDLNDSQFMETLISSLNISWRLTRVRWYTIFPKSR